MGGIVTFTLLNQSSSFSERKLLIDSVGPGSITSGESGEIKVNLTNNNNSPIKEAYLTIMYDSGENITGDKNIITQTVEVGDVLAKSEKEATLNFSIYGSEGMVKEIQPILHYKLADSKAEFTKNSSPVSIVLKTSPVSINVKALKEIHKDYLATFTITVKNNTGNNISDLLVTARNPHNFIFASTTYTLLNNTPSWKIANLAAKESVNIEMTGKITGEIGEKLNFTFYTGLTKNINTQASSSVELSNFDNYYLNIDNVYSKVEKSVLITGQYLDFKISEGKYANESTLTQGEVVTLNLDYKNNTGFPLSDLSFALNILGDNIVKDSLRVTNGFYDQVRNTILWNKNSALDFAKLGAYNQGSLQIMFRVKNEAELGSQIRIIGNASANRNSEDNVSNQQDTSIDKTFTITRRAY